MATYTVTYDTGGGSPVPAKQTADVGSKVKIAGYPSLNGFKTIAWEGIPSGYGGTPNYVQYDRRWAYINTPTNYLMEEYKPNTEYSFSADMTMYAIYTVEGPYSPNQVSILDGVASQMVTYEYLPRETPVLDLDDTYGETDVASNTVRLPVVFTTELAADAADFAERYHGLYEEGWHGDGLLDSVENVLYVNGDRLPTSRSCVLLAADKSTTHLVGYDPNGGIAYLDVTQVKVSGRELGLVTVGPTRPGYSFAGWSKSATNGTQLLTRYTDDADATFYAIYNRTITYDANGGGGAPSSQTGAHTAQITVTSSIPSRPGYSFDSWNTKADGTGTKYAAGGSYPANQPNITLYAQWNRTVTYNTNGGGAAPTAQTAAAGTAITLAAAQSRSGYSFKRWNTLANDTGTAYSAGASYPANNPSVTLYAIWNRTVTYNANSGSGAPSAQTDISTKSIVLSSTKPTRSGFTFVEWNTSSADTGTSYAAGGTYAANSPNVTLYAIWSRTVSYNANGGSGAPSSQSSLSNVAITLSSIKPNRAGWAFTGWNTAANGSGTSYAAGASYPTNTAGATLYAQWKRNVDSVEISSAESMRVGSNSATTEADEGTYAYIPVSYVIKGAAKATVTVTATCVDSSGASKTCSVASGGSANKPETEADYSGNAVIRASECDANTSYTFTITVTAKNSSVTQSNMVATRSVVLKTAYFTIDVKAGGHGISFGSAATTEMHNVSMRESYFDKPSPPIMTFDNKTAADAYITNGMCPCLVLCLNDDGLWLYEKS